MNKTPRFSFPLALGAVLLLAGLSGCDKAGTEYSGKELFVANCAGCHGLQGDGKGPDAAAQTEEVADLRRIAAGRNGRFPRVMLGKIIDGREVITAHGNAVMPAWGNEFSLSEGYSEEAQQRVERKIRALVDYIESIQINP